MRQRRARAGVAPFHSIFVRMTAFALLISVVPVLFVSVMALRRMEDMTEERLRDSYAWLVDEFIGNAEERLAQYDASLSGLSRNTTILDALTDDRADAYTRGRAVSAEVFKSVSMENHREIRDCVVYSMGPPAYGTSASTLTERDVELWRRSGWREGQAQFFAQTWDGRWTISLIYPIDEVSVQELTSRLVGLIRLELYIDQLFGRRSQGEYEVAVLETATERCLYASDERVAPLLDGWASGAADDGGYTALSAPVDGCGLTVVCLFDRSELAREKGAIKQLVVPIMLALAGTIVAVSYLYFRHFSRRVDALVQKFRYAAKGDLAPKPPIAGSDEIAMLDRQFGQMLTEMDDMNRRTLAQQNEIREEQFRNLQLQINPHFLYNTLETISAIGAVHGAFQVCDLCQRLGDIFRYSLGKNEGRYTAVANEIRQTQNYIFIQQVRYRFEAEFDVELDAEKVYMLRFLLQPIVENAEQHGLAHRAEPGKLQLWAGVRDGELRIRIADNGAGMPPDQLQSLRARLLGVESGGKGIGIWNIGQRIRLTHGAPYGVEVESRQGQGSAFTLRLPYITEDDLANEEV